MRWIAVILIGTENSAELTLWCQCITKEVFLRLDTVMQNLISGNYFRFSVPKMMKQPMKNRMKVFFFITITFGGWAPKIVSNAKTVTIGRRNQTVRKIMTNNRNSSMSIDINSALLTLRIQYE